MYGTVAHLTAAPGKRHLIGRLMDARAVPFAPGWIGSYLYEVDDQPDQAILVVLFDDRQSYHAGAASKEEDEHYLAMRALLTKNPVWNDGEVLPYMSFREPTPGCRPYGSVGRFTVAGKRGAVLRDHMDAQSIAWDSIRGLLAGGSLLTDKDPGLVFLISIFDSAESYRANSESPAQHQRYLQWRSLCTRDPDWYNGYVTPHLRF
jgi:heme-degrading monooxygenase HmoA